MKNWIYYLLLFYAVVCALSISFFNGTGDSGDSVTHFLFARYAPQHPKLFFDHWAKPLFVLLACPFAQMGFVGIKIFNSLIELAVIFFTYKAAVRIKLPNPFLAALFLMFAPLNYILTFSGLTEPLFALFTILGVYFCADRKFLTASVFISFLPYIRSEGLIVIGVFILYFLFQKTWKYLPWLFFGSVFYGIAGYFVHGSLFWVFTEIPYAKLSSVYGSGHAFHFVEQLINVTGVPVYFLFWTGLIWLLALFIKKQINAEQHILLGCGFLCFFIAHSIFWYLGIFNSMGLKRVFIGVMPLIALISLQGFNFIDEFARSRFPAGKKALQTILIAYVLLFPFTVNPSAIQWETDLKLNPDQKVANEVTRFVSKRHDQKDAILFNHRYLSLSLNRDYFDPGQCKQISRQTIDEMRTGNLLIWDNQYAVFESGLKKEDLDGFPQLHQLGIYQRNENKKEVVFAVYEKR